ncbi:MAG: DUF417 family protein [Bacteroidales bacterium]|jgi:uncharacterized membrane protein YkgB|nr:DUF417 family protein [Bacteroidales bacterium]HOI31338.1 DUF417 family protein [Bacteroidales bacterium]
MKNINFEKIGYRIAVWGVALVLLWIGVFKFTPTEAKAIEPLVISSFLMNWLYKILSLQAVSNLIGALEIITAVCLLLHFVWKKAGIFGGVLSSLTFLVTISFLFTTPNVFNTVDGVPITDFFILKDVMALGISIMVLGKSISK